MGKGEVQRIILWMCWVTQWLISSMYVAMSLITFGKLFQASAEVFVDQQDLLKNKIWRAPLASCILSALLVIGFDLLSCITLVKKSINRAGPGFGYGFLVAFCFSLAFFMLLSGLVLDGFKKVVVEILEQPNVTAWSQYNSDTYMATLVLALLCFCTFLIFGIILLCLQGGVSQQLGIETKPKYNPMFGPPPGEAYDNPFGGMHQMEDDAMSYSASDSAYNGGVTGKGYMNAMATPDYRGGASSSKPMQQNPGYPLAGYQNPGYQSVPSDFQEQAAYYEGHQKPAQNYAQPQQQEYSYMGAPGSSYAGYGYASLPRANATPATMPPVVSSENLLNSDQPAQPHTEAPHPSSAPAQPLGTTI